jgi:hypothetical protein
VSDVCGHRRPDLNDPHEATDALVEALGELRGAAGLSEQSSEPDMVAEHALR